MTDFSMVARNSKLIVNRRLIDSVQENSYVGLFAHSPFFENCTFKKGI